MGCCQLESRPDATAYLGLFAVAPPRQGDGLGRAIVTEAERVARVELGAERMVMTVIRQRTDLIAWYERLGYRRTGETQPFPYGDERFGLPTRPDLEFVVLAKPLAAARPHRQRSRRCENRARTRKNLNFPLRTALTQAMITAL